MKRLTKAVPYPDNVIMEIIGNKEVIEDMRDGYYHVLATLGDRQQDMLYRRYHDRQTYEQIGNAYGITKSRVRELIWKSLRSLRRPSRRKFVENGLYYQTILEEEEKQRRERYRNVANGIPLADMEEISVRTYNCLCRKGFTTLSEVNEFVKANGPEWYRKINSLGIKSKEEIEKAIDLYGLNEQATDKVVVPIEDNEFNAYVCPNCESEVNNECKYCYECGAKLNWADAKQ